MNDSWNAKDYSKFLDLRTRPARDMLSTIPDTFQPRTVYDLGCGPGNSTILLKNRWPHSKIVGLDSSLEMLREAKASFPTINFIKDDIAHFSPTEKIDLIFANASLQWLDEHEVIIPRLLQLMNPGGTLGIQMPNNFHSPSHQTILKILQKDTTWQPLLNKLRYGILTQPLYNLSWYYDLLTRSGVKSLQLWETEYFQEMPNYQGILNWVKGTALRPILSAMDDKNQNQFSNAYVQAIEAEYPLQENNKILLPFRRIFMVGYK